MRGKADKNRINIIIVLCNFILSTVVVYISPRFDIITLSGFVVVNLVIYIMMTLSDRRNKKNIEERIEGIFKLLHSTNTDSDNYEVIDDEFGKLSDEIYKIISENKIVAGKAEKSREVLREYTEDIAHQIKTPLTGALLMLDLMEDDPENSKEYISHIRNSINRLHKLTDALLKMASLDSGNISMKKEQAEAISLLEDIKTDLEIYFADKEIPISIYGDDITLICDKQWTYEAVFNIMKNGIEASPEKGVEIHLKETNIFKSIIVKDFGKGLSDEILKRAYQRFYKENPDSKGYGIGLPMAKSIMEKQNGELLHFRDKTSNNFELRFYK
ncbi:MAG: HAMP domain-containing histidine kinase [Clostridiales bacterium]|nr:HAMP domain-containing histidine kinase [Clostridiales bacterium]